MPRKRNWVWSWLFTERGLGFQTRITERGRNSEPLGLKSSALFNPLLHRTSVGHESNAVTTQPRCLGSNLHRDAHHTYCSSTNQCLQILTTGKKTCILRLVAFQARVINGTNSHRQKIYKRESFATTCRYSPWISMPSTPSLGKIMGSQGC